MQPFLLFIDCQLLSVCVLLHLGLLGALDFVQFYLALGDQVSQFKLLVTLAVLNASEVVLVVLCQSLLG